MRWVCSSAFALGVFALSGATGIAYQVVWARQWAAGLGHELPAVLAVITAVMMGLALGSWAFDTRVSRSLAPGRWYALLEWGIGFWALVLAWAVPRLHPAWARWFGAGEEPWRQIVAAFGIPMILLAPATLALGATLPAMERFVARLRGERPSVALVYAVNTAGAAAGVLLTVWWLLPALGLQRTALCLASLNFSCGALLWFASSRVEAPIAARPEAGSGAKGPAVRSVAGTVRASAGTLPAWGCAAAVTGFLGIGVEVLSLRFLSQVLDNTVYTYATVLAVFLVGTAAGAVLEPRVGRRTGPRGWPEGWLAFVGASVGIGMLALPSLGPVTEGVRHRWAGFTGAAAAELAAATTLLLLPTLGMGAVFSRIGQQLRSEEGGLGRAAGWNMLGGAAAPLLVGALGLPWLGGRVLLLLVALGYVLLSVGPGRGRSRGRWVRAAVLSAALAAVAWRTDARLLELPAGAVVREYRQGLLGTVAVVEERDGSRVLRVDNRFQMGGTSAVEPQSRQAHLPLLLHPAPRRALFLGTGTGITLGAATLHTGLRIEGVELLREVVETMPQFEPFNRHPYPGSVQLRVADARRYVAAHPGGLDVIVADLFHPGRDGAGLLFTREHFAAVRRCLAPGGIFCQWLPLHQLDEPTLRIILATFLEVYPDSEAWLLWYNVDTPVVGLMGFRDLRRAAASDSRVRGQGALAEELRRFGLSDPIRYQGHWLAGSGTLREWVTGVPIATDDVPRVLFAAPRLRWRGDAPPYGRLLTLLSAAEQAEPGAEPSAAAEGKEGLAGYRRARNAYLRALAAAAQGREEEAVAGFLDSARLSADFTHGYAQCLTRISLRVRTDPAAARALAERLVEAQPAHPVGRQLLERLRAPDAGAGVR